MEASHLEGLGSLESHCPVQGDFERPLHCSSKTFLCVTSVLSHPVGQTHRHVMVLPDQAALSGRHGGGRQLVLVIGKISKGLCGVDVIAPTAGPPAATAAATATAAAAAAGAFLAGIVHAAR